MNQVDLTIGFQNIQGGFAHVYLVRMKEFPDPIVLKRIAVPDTERLKSVEKEIVFMVCNQ